MSKSTECSTLSDLRTLTIKSCCLIQNLQSIEERVMSFKEERSKVKVHIPILVRATSL